MYALGTAIVGVRATMETLDNVEDDKFGGTTTARPTGDGDGAVVAKVTGTTLSGNFVFFRFALVGASASTIRNVVYLGVVVLFFHLGGVASCTRLIGWRRNGGVFVWDFFGGEISGFSFYIVLWLWSVRIDGRCGIMGSSSKGGLDTFRKGELRDRSPTGYDFRLYLQTRKSPQYTYRV